MNGRDAGLQPERTVLAWRRTAIAVAINAILLLRVGLERSQSVVTACGLFLLGVALVLTLVGFRRGNFLLESANPPAPKASSMLLASSTVVLGGVVTALSYLWSLVTDGH